MTIDVALAAWCGAAAMAVLAVAAWWGDQRRRQRADLDRVGLIDWPTVQVIAVLAALILASIALNA